ncbi:MAG: hypothetical protein PWP38_2295 [Clostridiales bacterium]|nr:hypothetical protein [Clostridiales bacterium]
MIIAIIGVILGIVIGLYLPFEFTTISSLYVSVGILAAIDSILGALRASFENRFDGIVFLTGFFINALVAIALSYIGDKLGVPIYYAAIFVFGTRMFNNIGIIRNESIDKIREKNRNKSKL